MLKDNKGITLVEILATITLLSVIGILVWSVFIQGIKNTNEGAMKTRLTQEMNYVQATLRKIHQTADNYKITFPTNCSIHVEYNNEGVSSTTLFEDNRICYEIFIEGEKKEDLLEINPKGGDHSISIDFVLSDKNNFRNNVTILTNLSRLKED